MMVKECMTNSVELAEPNMTIKEVAIKMKKGDFGIMPVGENDRLIGMITDRDIAIRAVAEGLDPSTKVRDVMSKEILYCYEDQTIDEVAQNMGDNQVRRLPVLNREKRMVGILSLGDVAYKERMDGQHAATEALAQISARGHREPQPTMNA